MIDKQTILDKTDNGLDAFAHYCSKMGFDKYKLNTPFRWMRPHERSESTRIKQMSDGLYYITDFGDDKKGYNIFDFVMREFKLTFSEAVRKINQDLQLNLLEVLNAKKQKFEPIPFKSSNLSDRTFRWFALRGFSAYTLQRFMITESLESVFVKSLKDFQKRTCINFNYFKDGELFNVKYRDAEKNFKLTKGAPLLFYGLDFIKDQKECIITEGEPDALAYYEAGFYSVCSVPNGAVKRTNQTHQINLEYLDNCYEYFEGMEMIYLATDNDEAGDALAEELSRRLGKERCKRVTQPNDWKDANLTLLQGSVFNLSDYINKDKKVDEIAYNEAIAQIERLKLGGIELLKQTIAEAKEYPVEGIVPDEDIQSAVLKIYLEGYPKTLGVGYPTFDNLFSLRTDASELTIITGSPGSGKTTFATQYLALHAKINGLKTLVFSPESQYDILSAKIISQYVGKGVTELPPKNLHKRDYHKYQQMTRQELDLANNWLVKHFKILKVKSGQANPEFILAKGKEMLQRFGIKNILIDPWNMMEHKQLKGEMQTDYIGRILSIITYFIEECNMNVFIVAHPTKLKKTGKGYEVPTLYEISGSANFYNKTHNGLSLWQDPESRTTLIHTQKIKVQEFVGSIGYSEFNFNPCNGRFTEVGQPDFPLIFEDKPKLIDQGDYFIDENTGEIFERDMSKLKVLEDIPF